MTGRTARGLTGDEAARRLVEHGPNELPPEVSVSLLARIGQQLRDPMILLLCGALVLVVAVGDHADAVIIAAVIVLNTTIGVVQDVRAQHAVDALSRMAAPRAHVWRDGALVEVAAGDVVPGDTVRLEAGDIVPADLLLVEASSLEVDESTMTGESMPVPRALAEEVVSGTVVTRGRGIGRVVRTGADSGLGRIAALVAGAGLRPTPLQLRLARLSRQLVLVTSIICLGVFGLAMAQGMSWTAASVLAVSLGVAAVPESLPAVVTISLALGARRMARRSAVVRRLPAVETLGSVTVLASDKTGTLTQGVLTARQLWTPAGTCEVSGTAYAVDGRVEGSPEARAEAVGLLRNAALCNDASLRAGDEPGEWLAVGDPFDVALLVAAAKGGLDLDSLAHWNRIDESPFDSDVGFSRTVHSGPDGVEVEVLKGAPERLLPMLAPGPVAEQARVQAELWAAQGHRVLAVLEDRRAVGLVAVTDPPQPDAAQVVEDCHAAGIRIVLVTGDHPATARVVAEELGILSDDGLVVEGEAVARGEHLDLVEQIDVYSRVRPEQKVGIVDAWQAHGDVVAMTGDGVNDAPALRRADIGVAMGRSGTEVARQAADLVLLDDDLRTLVVAVGEGRRIHANIRTFLRYGLAGGLAEIVVLLTAPLLGLPIPLTPAMILWVNMVTHGLPGVAFGGEPLDPDLMRRPSPPPTQSVLDRGLIGQIVAAGALLSVASLGAGLLASHLGQDVRTAVFLTLGLGQLAVALALRAPRRGWDWRERGLEIAVLLAGACQLTGVAIPGVRELLGTEPLGTGMTVALVGIAALPGVLVALSRRPWSRRQGTFASGPGPVA
ncbi:cation-transporting P-type ATPase [Nocardioides sp.]|uniref:cation-translocating P-type ATPase n=1 Tax=Nocardioides sp. TaxID=35761 RepID=UPI001A182701|nr:cation-transporting P-type ATPase [Nocardioides sp.]MBJ7356769.1 cation-transporting P-type ATPase [Nocardioides sp.]